MKKFQYYKTTLTTHAPLRVGAPRDVMSGIDNPIAKIGDRVVIQGTTLKGALRSKIEEYLIDTYSDKDLMKPCIPSSENTLSLDEKVLIQKGIYREGGACSYSSDDSKKRSESICPVCYFLGAMGLGGFVRVPYLYTNVQPGELYAVRIDRASGVGVEKTNRSFQIMEDGLEFVGELEVLNKDTQRRWEVGKKREGLQGNVDRWLEEKSKGGKRFLDLSQEELIKEFVIENLNKISIIGGFKSKGSGKVKIDIKAI